MSSTRSSASNQCEWRSATDNKTGRIYYYNVRTKETTWNKPLELASPDEQRNMIQKREETLAFFREMEQNIKDRIKRAAEVESITNFDSNSYNLLERRSNSFEYDDSHRVRFSSTDNNGYEGRARLNSLGLGPPRRIRTISTMDDDVLLLMRQSSGEDRSISQYNMNISQTLLIADEKRNGNTTGQNNNNNLRGAKDTNSSRSMYDIRDDKDVKDAKTTQDLRSLVSPPTIRRRRNSTGTIYLATTMSSQDNESTIHCCCVVIRAHMISAAKENIIPLPLYDVFKDPKFANDAKNHSSSSGYKDTHTSPMALIPSLATVREFFMLVFSKSQLESDCIIMALIYCERLVKETKGRLCIRYDNWRSILFACLVMASKVWDDLSMWNVDFSQVHPSFNLSRVNELELAMLDALKYVIRVSASEYAKYYFHLRSMMVKLGVHSQDLPGQLKPLDISGARKLQLSTEKYEEMTVNKPRRRHYSMPEGFDIVETLNNNNNTTSSVTVGLEQIVHTDHMDADGQVHTIGTKKKSSISMTNSPMSKNTADDNNTSSSGASTKFTFNGRSTGSNGAYSADSK